MMASGGRPVASARYRQLRSELEQVKLPFDLFENHEGIDDAAHALYR